MGSAPLFDCASTAPETTTSEAVGTADFWWFVSLSRPCIDSAAAPSRFGLPHSARQSLSNWPGVEEKNAPRDAVPNGPVQDGSQPLSQSSACYWPRRYSLPWRPRPSRPRKRNPQRMASARSLPSAEEIVVVGSRGEGRSVAESMVPVDVLAGDDLLSQGDTDVANLIRNLAPSYNVSMQPISDASSIVRPAYLRNLAPDHTLVLVNGKRRHRAAVIHWHGDAVSIGAQGPDLAVIPAIALRQVEVLRDGASAQYRIRRHRRRDELPAEGRKFGRFGRGSQWFVRRGRRRPVHGCRELRPAAGWQRLLQPQRGVRKHGSDGPVDPAPGCREPDRRRQHACSTAQGADLGFARGVRRHEAVPELRSSVREQRPPVLRSRELRQQDGERWFLLPQPEHPRRRVQQRRWQHPADRRSARRPGRCARWLRGLPDRGRDQPRAGPDRARVACSTIRTASPTRSSSLAVSRRTSAATTRT